MNPGLQTLVVGHVVEQAVQFVHRVRHPDTRDLATPVQDLPAQRLRQVGKTMVVAAVEPLDPVTVDFGARPPAWKRRPEGGDCLVVDQQVHVLNSCVEHTGPIPQNDVFNAVLLKPGEDFPGRGAKHGHRTTGPYPKEPHGGPEPAPALHTMERNLPVTMGRLLLPGPDLPPQHCPDNCG